MAHRFSKGVHLLLIIGFLLGSGLTTHVRPLIADTSQPTATPQTSSASQTKPVSTQSYAAAKKEQDAVFRQIANLRKLLDRSQFDLAELGHSLEGDANMIVAFMRSEIVFEQYPGLLRGAQGTLMSRAGNALDQSALLERLLLDAGYEAKIQHGLLGSKDALRLLQQMFAKRAAPLPISKKMDKVQTLLENLVANSGLSSDQITALVKLSADPPPIQSSDAFSSTLNDADYLQGLITDAGVTLGDSEAEGKLVEEAKDYFWVDYRLGPSEKWQSVHPAFGAADAPADLISTESFADESAIPEALQQRFQMQVSIERKVGDRIETVPLFEPLNGVTANMLGHAHTFAIVPDGYTDVADFKDPIGALNKSNMFFPSFDGKLVGDANFFDLLGNLIPPGAALSPLAPLITGVSKSLEGALDALNSAGDASDVRKDDGYFLLTGVYVDYTLRAPGHEPMVFHRTLVDRIGAENRANGVWKLRNGENNLTDLIELTSRYTLMLSPSSVPQSYMAEAQLKHIYDLKTFFDFALGSEFQRPGFQSIANAKLDRYDFTWSLHPVIYNLFDTGAAAISAINYRPTPSLVLYKEQQNGKTTSSWTDVVNNQRRAYRLQNGKIVDDSAALLTTGVWETRTEGAVINKNADKTALFENVFTLFKAANEQKIAHQLLTQADVAKLEKMQLPADALPQLRADLQAGYLIILPQSLPTGVTEFGWWRIDPTSGQTLGVNQQGMGAAATEYNIVVSIIAGSLCGAYAFSDPDGLTVQDAVVCAATSLGGYAALAKSVEIGVLTAGILTGYWLNKSPALQYTLIRP